MSFAPGQTLGNYRIVARIGVGGMGEVYLAEHPLIGKRVALKVIHPELSTNREVVHRFFTEARATNKIGDEHIVAINDFGQSEAGDHFFVMEYLEGKNLAQALAGIRVMPVPRVLHIGAQIAAALGAAHGAGIIHRDLKPDNVMLVTKLGDPDFVKVLDFGLAKIFADGDGHGPTAAGVVLGTPYYMSPEACESRPGIDHRSDIYSLGVLLFQMLTGQLPFYGESMGAVMVKQVAHPPPPPRGVNPDVPPAVEQVVLRCLAKVPAARFQSMGELREALLDPQRYLASSPPIMPSAGPDQRTMLEGVRGRPSSAPPIQPTVRSGRAPVDDRSRPLPAMRQPAPVTNRTMAIMTPPGYNSRPPRRGRVVAAVVGAALLIGGGAALVTGGGGGADDDAAAARRVRIGLATRPVGASVLDGQGAVLGVTPVEIELPVSAEPVTLTFRHPGHEDQQRTFVPAADASFLLELAARAPPAASPAGAPAVPAAAGTSDASAAGTGAPAASATRSPASATTTTASAGDAGTPAAIPGAPTAAPGRKPAPGRAGDRKPGRPSRTRAGDGTLAPDFGVAAAGARPSARHPRARGLLGTLAPEVCSATPPTELVCSPVVSLALAAVSAVVVALAAVALLAATGRRAARERLAAARATARGALKAAELEAAARRRQVETEARQAALEQRTAADRDLGAAAEDLVRRTERAATAAAELEAEARELDARLAALDDRQRAIEAAEGQGRALATDRGSHEREVRRRLEELAGATGAEVKARLAATWIEEARAEAAQVVRQIEGSAADPDVGREARRLIDIATSRYRGHFLTERAISNVPLAHGMAELLSADGAGLLAGIQAGANVQLHLSDTGHAVRLEGLDGVGREIARRALARLAKKPEAASEARRDPAAWMAKIRTGLDQEIVGLGKKAFQVLEIQRPHPEIVSLVGRLNYRTSYTQNQWLHAVEASFLAGMMAAEMGLDVRLTRRATLMHDIGKALTHEIDGSHAVIGADIARRLGEAEIVANAIGAHHADEPPNSIYAFLVAAADALSGARPGARREHTDGYSTKLEDLERIGASYRGVDRAFAVHGGRELRVYVHDGEVDDLRAVEMSSEIAARISDEMTFPGQIKVTVIRTTEAIDIAS